MRSGPSQQGATRQVGGQVLGLVLLAPTLLVLASCQSGPAPSGGSQGGGSQGWSLPYDLGSGVQEGEVTVREGADTEIRYKKPYQSAPKLVLVELRGAKALETLYSKDDFQIVRQEAAYFRVRNNHVEHNGESWATIKWRAEGTLASRPSGGLSADGDQLAKGDKNAQELLIENIKSAGGKVSIDPNAPKEDDAGRRMLADRDALKGSNSPIDVTLTSNVDPRLGRNSILAVDLHRTNTSDADLVRLEGQTSLRTLNLYGTKITDAGLKSLSGMTSLQTLYLNSTAVTDAGLQYLQGLKTLSELGLNQTQVTDEGLVYLRTLGNLHSLSLSGTKVTDRGLEQLKGLKTLKRLHLVRTGVTPAGIQDLKKSLPNLQVSK